ncbi:MAG: T9SS type A sorting domain-containing protein, partial [Bacteroidota bacterium]
FYRIKATETTGNSFYSSIVHLTKVNKPQVFTVNPNPVTNSELTFRLTNAEPGRYVFSIINTQGQPIQQRILNHTGGDISRQINTTGLPAGVYQLVLWSVTKRYSQKFINVY